MTDKKILTSGKLEVNIQYDPVGNQDNHYFYTEGQDLKSMKREYFMSVSSGSTPYVEKISYKKQEKTKNYFGHDMYHGDVKPSHSQTDINNFFTSSGDYVFWKDHYRGTGSYHAYNVTYGLHSTTKDKVWYSAERAVGMCFKMKFEGDDYKKARTRCCINEIVMHYTDTGQTKKFKNVKIHPGGMDDRYDKYGIRFRDTYSRSASDPKMDQFSSSDGAFVYAWHRDRTVLTSTWDWCGFSISWWIKGGDDSDIEFRPRISLLNPIMTSTETDNKASGNHSSKYYQIYKATRPNSQRRNYHDVPIAWE